MTTPTVRRAAAAIACACCCVTASFAASGRVVGPDGKPLEGAKACLVAGQADLLCAPTDAAGYFKLPDATSSTLRVSHAGYFPREVAAVDQESPIALELAASFRARLLDAATGKPIPKGEIFLTFATGRRKGPFPCNAAGVEVATIDPGEAIPSATAKGYKGATGDAVHLVAGKQTSIELRLERE